MHVSTWYLLVIGEVLIPTSRYLLAYPDKIESPLGSPHMQSRRRPGAFKCKFTPAEDARLRGIVERLGCRNWTAVASLMGDRDARQCRERWTNYIDPGLRNSPWTSSEEALLEEKFAIYGSQWHTLGAFFPNRSKNQIKNHWQRNHKQSMPMIREIGPKPESPPLPAAMTQEVQPLPAPSESRIEVIFAEPDRNDSFWAELGIGSFWGA
jgi:hypothetical protein